MAYFWTLDIRSEYYKLRESWLKPRPPGDDAIFDELAKDFFAESIDGTGRRLSMDDIHGFRDSLSGRQVKKQRGLYARFQQTPRRHPQC